MSRRLTYFLKLAKAVFLNEAVSRVSDDEIRKRGAQAFAKRLIKASTAISDNAYQHSAFLLGNHYHQFSSNMNGISYHVNGMYTGMVASQKDIDRMKTATVAERYRTLATLEDEAKTSGKQADKESKEIENNSIYEEGRRIDKAKEKGTGGEKDEEVNTTFNLFIDFVLQNIPSKTTASGLQGDSWFNIANKAASDLLGDDQRSRHWEDDNGTKSVSFMIEGDDNKIHKVVLNSTGLSYAINGIPLSFKPYDDIITDFLKKRNE